MALRFGRWSASNLPVRVDRPVRVRFARALANPRGFPVHAASHMRRREISLEAGLQRRPAELRRIATHEVFHFAWIRLGNPRRRAYEQVLAGEWRSRVRGELGWSAESRKVDLRAADVRGRTRAWREYVCESFCDTAAWLYSGAGDRHAEFTLSRRARDPRRKWFEEVLANGPFPI